MTTAVHNTECLICLRPIAPGDDVQPCSEPTCGQPYHRACWEYLGGCARYGCPQMKEVKKPEIDVSFWGACQKQCPMCAETIPMAALTCPYCSTLFHDIKPVTREDMKPKQRDPALRALQNKAVWMLILGLLGFPSPFVLVIGGIWYRNHRAEIERAESVTRALAIMGLLVSGLYLVMLVIGVVLYALAKS